MAKDRNWQEEPATEKQIAWLRSQGHRLPKRLTKGRASQLIEGEPTEGQLRRLKFYGISPPKYLSKKGASELIDEFKDSHPESEANYQKWKKGHGCWGGCVKWIVIGFVLFCIISYLASRK